MRRSTIIYLLLLVILAGVYYYLNNREQPADIAVTLEPEQAATYLFDADEGTPTSIRIESKDGDIVEVAHDADNAWALKLPLEASADQGASEAAASQITTLRILDTIPGLDLEIAGLKSPEYILIVKFNDVERKVNIGVITPTANGYYALSPQGDVVILSASAVDSLLSLLTSPPYLETPTPSPMATETPLPSSTPEAGAATPTTTTPQP
jgi:hypothetical protein